MMLGFDVTSQKFRAPSPNQETAGTEKQTHMNTHKPSMTTAKPPSDSVQGTKLASRCWPQLWQPLQVKAQMVLPAVQAEALEELSNSGTRTVKQRKELLQMILLLLLCLLLVLLLFLLLLLLFLLLLLLQAMPTLD